MSIKKLGAAIAVATTLGLSASAQAASVGSGWEYFSFGNVGSETTVSFTASEAANLVLADVFLSGDQFTLYLDGVLLGTTSTPTVVGASTSDPDYALTDSRWSSGSWLIDAGEHTLEIDVIASPYGSGGAYYELTSAVPEPGNLALLALGLAGIGLKARRRKTA